MTPIVELKNVSKHYGDVTAVNEINLEITEGEFFTLLGPSGCGKTTTLRLIAGFLRPDRGDIMIKGHRVNEEPPYNRNLGVVFQNYALFPHMTVFDNIAYGLKSRRVSDTVIREKVENSLELVGLRGFDKRYPAQLSGGQQQRVALARAIVISPDVLLLDEPLSSLDLKLRQKMRRELKLIQKEIGITTVYVTHDQGEAFAMSDRIAVMDRGRLMQLGSAREIYTNPRERFVAEFIGETNMLNGTIVESHEGYVLVSIREGIRLRVPKTSETVGGRKEVMISIRPEVVELSRTDSQNGRTSQDSMGPGVIVNIEYLGSVTRFYVDFGGDLTIISETRSGDQSQDYRLGDSVLVRWDVNAAAIISSANRD